VDLVQAYIEYVARIFSGEWLWAYLDRLSEVLPMPLTDLAVISAAALLALFAFGLIAGRDDVIEGAVFVSAALLFFGLLIVGGAVLLAAGFFLLATLLVAAYLFYTADPIIKAAVVAAAAAGLAALTRRRSEKEEDVVIEEDCMPLKEGLRVLPLDVRTVIKKVLKRPAGHDRLCFHVYRGSGVAGGRDLVMMLELSALSETIARINKMLNELGYPSVADADTGRIYFKFKPDKPLTQIQPAASQQK